MTLSILIAEDAKLVREMLQGILVQNGHFDLTMAEDGEEALQLVRARALVGKSYDVIICDWEMPGRNGLDFLRQANLIIALQKSAVLMITSVNDLGRVKEALEFGVDDYLLKPFEPKTFYDRLARSLAKKRLSAA